MARILIVEDNYHNRKLFQLLVNVLGHDALLAENGVDGVNKAGQERPDIILMDIQMPVLDGFGALQQLKESSGTKDIPVIALTAYAMKGDQQRLLEAGFDDYLAKPINREDFSAVIARWLPDNSMEEK